MRLPIAAAVAGILGSFISPASAADVDPDTSFAVVGYMRAYGCSLNATQVDLFLPDLKIDEETYQSVLADLVDRGFATGDATERDAGVTLTPAFCGVTKGNDPRATLIEVMRYNDCGLSPQDPPRLLMPVGFMPDTFKPVLGELMASGDVTQDSANNLVLAENLCAGPQQ